MKDLGAAKKILGMEIHRDRQAGNLFLSQKNDIKQILDRFGMGDCKPVSTPLAAHFKLSSASYPQKLPKAIHHYQAFLPKNIHTTNTLLLVLFHYLILYSFARL